jgi:hypothetical protein
MTETGQTVHDELVRLMPSYAGRVDFTFLEDYSMPEILATLRNLPSNSVVFYSFFSHDKTGRFFEYDQSATAIAKASTAPVYGAWDFNLGYGMVGGKLISGFYQGWWPGRSLCGCCAARIRTASRWCASPPTVPTATCSIMCSCSASASP